MGRALLAGEDLRGDLGVLGGLAAGDRLDRRLLEPEVLGLGEPLLGAPAGDLDHAGAPEGELVHPVVGRDDQRVLAAEADQGLGDRLLEVAVGDAEELALGAGRVGQRAEEVEDRAHRQLLADRDDVRGRLVVLRGEHEAEADLVDAGRDLLGRQLDRHPERLEHVGRAGAAGRRAVAVLGDLAARRRRRSGPRWSRR